MRNPESAASSSACRRETVGSWIARSHVTARPATKVRPGVTRKALLPLAATSFKIKRSRPGQAPASWISGIGVPYYKTVQLPG